MQQNALMTDFYQLTMAYGYWKAGMDQREAVFHLFFRSNPFQGGYTLTAGLESVIDYLEHYTFRADDLAYLEKLQSPDGSRYFEPAFLDYLSALQFSCDLDAMPEGSLAFPYEPLLRIQGPLLQCQLLESPLLNLTNFASLIATKASRLLQATEGDSILEFGLRRAQGPDGGLTASRSAYLGGCDSTSNVLAGKLFDIPVRGTHSHSWVMAFPTELASFETYAEHLGQNAVFLVDTYDTLTGIQHAINIGKRLQKEGKPLLAVRLDSGDLAYLSIQARRLLDKAGFQNTKIIATNVLDEWIISDLKKQGSKIDIWGVGTNLVTAKDEPALDGVYKLSAIKDERNEWRYTLKLSERSTKISNPGIPQVKRFFQGSEMVADMLYDVRHPPEGDYHLVDPFDPLRQKALPKETPSVDLLVPIFRKGERIYDVPSLESIRTKAQQELSRLHRGCKRFLHPHQYVVGMERGLHELKMGLIQEIKSSLLTN